jgi:Leucine-rich repeat (LRR) protein
MLLKTDLEMINKNKKNQPIPPDVVITDLNMILSASKIDNKPVDTKNFAGLEIIEEINLKNMRIEKFIKNGNFNPFNLKSLQKLDISDNYLSSVQSLESCFYLEWMDISNNRINDFSSLKYCPKLKSLLANNNRVTSLSGFSEFESI